MAKDRNGSISKEEIDDDHKDYKDHHRKSKRKKDESTDSSDDDRKHRNKTKKKRSHRYHDSSSDDRKHRSKTKKKRSHRHDNSSSSYDSDSESGSESESLGSDMEEREGDRRRRKRGERDSEKERRRREKERKRKREKDDRRKKKEKDKKKKKKDENVGKKGAVTNSWGKYGIVRETDMWNKRPEFTAWLGEVKQVNLETLANWEEKQMFKEFMEDHNTATFPSKKFYDLDAYYRRQIEKEVKKGLKRATNSERTVFDDEEQRRLELQRERNRQKEEEIEALKCSMQSGMAQAMKEQARLREEMAYQYKLGNFEVAAAIQKRLDPDVAM